MDQEDCEYCEGEGWIPEEMYSKNTIPCPYCDNSEQEIDGAPDDIFSDLENDYFASIGESMYY